VAHPRGPAPVLGPETEQAAAVDALPGAQSEQGGSEAAAVGAGVGAPAGVLALQAELTIGESRALQETIRALRVPPVDVAARYDPALWQHLRERLGSLTAARGARRQNYALADGLYAAGFFNVMLRNADHVTMANQAQLVNLLGLIETSQTDCYGTPEYLAYQLYVDHAGSVALAVDVTGPTFDVPELGNMPARDGVPYLDVAASYDQRRRRLFLHVVNRHPTESADVAIELHGLTPSGSSTAHELNGPDVWARNTFEDHRHVRITTRSAGAVAQRFTHRFAAHSATSLEIECV
jgi:alpha-L-arabinofuranosidase